MKPDRALLKKLGVTETEYHALRTARDVLLRKRNEAAWRLHQLEAEITLVRFDIGDLVPRVAEEPAP